MEKIKKGFKIFGGLVLFLALILIIVPGCNKRRELARKNTPPSPLVNPVVAAEPEPPTISHPEVIPIGKSSWYRINTPRHERCSFRFKTVKPNVWVEMMRDGDTNTIVVYPGTGSVYGPGIIGGERGLDTKFRELRVCSNDPDHTVTADVEIYFVKAMNR